MVTAYLFDQRQGKDLDSWADSLGKLTKSQILWLDVTDPSKGEEREVIEALGLSGESLSRLGDPEGSPMLDQQEGYLRVTAVAVSDKETSPDRETVVVDCFTGRTG